MDFWMNKWRKSGPLLHQLAEADVVLNPIPSSEHSPYKSGAVCTCTIIVITCIIQM